VRIYPFFVYLCSMIHRELRLKIEQLRDKFPVLVVTGPRQSGKTTLLRALYPDLPYVSLEELDNRTMATDDPRGFLSNYQNGAILDEVQRTPEIFSYIQGIVDTQPAHFVLSGSHNFQLLENISQTLAGRSALLVLLPLSFSELNTAGSSFENYAEFILSGFYPRLHVKGIEPEDFFPSYIATYLEKDVRLIKNIENLHSFSRFIQLCAGRIGHPLNLSSLAADAAISPNTAKKWLSVLEAGYIIFLLKPYHENFNKQIIKSPKLYFYDTGLACSLLGLENVGQVNTYYQRGALFENLVIADIMKQYANLGKRPRIFFWQSKTKHEIDLLIEYGGKIFPIEIKSGLTRHEHFLKNIAYWQKLNDDPGIPAVAIYGGDDDFKSKHGLYLSWRNISNIFNILDKSAF